MDKLLRKCFWIISLKLLAEYKLTIIWQIDRLAGCEEYEVLKGFINEEEMQKHLSGTLKNNYALSL